MAHRKEDKEKKRGGESEVLVAEGTADCAEPMEKAGRGGTKFSLANDKTVFAGGALAFSPRQGVGAARFPPSLTSTPGFLGLLALRSLLFAGSGYKGSEEILNTVIPSPAQPFKFPTREIRAHSSSTEHPSRGSGAEVSERSSANRSHQRAPEPKSTFGLNK
ncbi:hypothetical protein ACRRTK_011874 [Alexandromys fortis]